MGTILRREIFWTMIFLTYPLTSLIYSPKFRFAIDVRIRKSVVRRVWYRIVANVNEGVVRLVDGL